MPSRRQPMPERLLVAAAAAEHPPPLHATRRRPSTPSPAGKDVVIVTGTAIGKTLCYNLPVAATLLDDPAARALYLFPTKALAQDQLGTLQRWAAEEELERACSRPAVYDGDTPSPQPHARSAPTANVVLTNPDMLHVGILPYHGKWHAFLRQPAVHRRRRAAHLPRHLRQPRRRRAAAAAAAVRALRLAGRRSSAARPPSPTRVELAERLTGRQMTLIDNDGSPRGRKYFVLWNPPFLDERRDVSRRSANVEAVELLTELVRRRAQTIVFTKARVVAELIYKYAVRAARPATATWPSASARTAAATCPTSGGEIEQELFAGKLLAVAATNALELGIDVGSLDAAILVGFPGTICSTWQQAGRAGRTSQDSLVVLVGYNEPIDQYLMRHPEYLFGASARARRDRPGQPAHPGRAAGLRVLREAADAPTTSGTSARWRRRSPSIAAPRRARCKAIDGRYYWPAPSSPPADVNLRTDQRRHVRHRRRLAPAARSSARWTRSPRRSWSTRRRSTCTRARATSSRELDLAGQDRPRRAGRGGLLHPAGAGQLLPPGRAARTASRTSTGELFFGPADVTWQTTAFRKMKYYTMELIGQGELDLPAQTLSTTAHVVDARRGDAAATWRRPGYNPIEAMMGVRNLMLAALPAWRCATGGTSRGMVDSANLGAADDLRLRPLPRRAGLLAERLRADRRVAGHGRAIVTRVPVRRRLPKLRGPGEPPPAAAPGPGPGRRLPRAQQGRDDRLLDG